MKEIESEGKTVQEAIDKGLKKLGISRDDVDVKVLSEGKTGLFGLMGASPAKVKITPKGSAQAPAAESSRTSEKTPSLVTDDAVEKVISVLKNILKLMGIKSDVKATVDNDYIHADVITEDSALLIGRKGQNRNTIGSVILLQFYGRADAVQNRHSAIHEYNIRVKRKSLVHGFSSVFRRFHIQIHFTEDFHKELLRHQR